MKITKSQLQQIIQEELKALHELEDWEPRSEYNVGDLIEVEISDDGYDKSIVNIADEAEFVPTHGVYTSEKFLAKIIQVSQMTG
jgi:hypothetical protein